VENISRYLLEGNNLGHVSSYFALGSIALYLVYVVIMKVFFPKKYHGVKFTTKNIAYISMMTAVAAAVTIVISITIPITVLPPIRVAFEGIMIKIAGMFFGPLVGLIVGLSTEALTILFVPSYIHPAFLLTAVMFGFIGGLTAFTQKFTGKKVWITFAIINVFIILYGTLMFFVTSSYDGEVNIYGFKIPTAYYWIVFIGSIAITLSVVWIVTIIGAFINKGKALETILPILLLAVLAEYIVTTLIASWGNANFLGTPRDSGYSSLVATAFVIAPLKIVWNTIMLSTVYYVMRPLVLLKKDK